MESYIREFGEHLPLALDGKPADVHVDTKKLIQTIKSELLEDSTDEEKEMLKNIFKRIETAALMITIGDDDDLLYRGAIELRRILSALVSFRFGLDTTVRFDELAQIYIKGGIVPSELDEYELLDEDVAIFEALGKFGLDNDEYNEQTLSVDFYPIIRHDTQISDFSVMDVVAWLVS